MKKLIVIIICFVSAQSLTAQKLDGLWYSSDSTRVYEINKIGENKYTAVLKSSTRKAESPGCTVIKELEYNQRRKRYEGIISAVADGETTRVKIKFSKTDTNKIVLRLSRMFVLAVNINWIKMAV